MTSLPRTPLRDRNRLRRPSSGGWILALVAAVVAPGLLCAQERAPDPSELQRFEDLARVFEVQVPVNVTRRDGSPVRDLTAEDFEVLVEGEPQEIRSFRVVDLELIEPDPLRPELAEEEIPSAARRYFLFLFDLTFSSPTALVRARLAARDFVLENMHATDLAAVATHSVEDGAKLIMTFSPDRAQLARAIDTLGAPKLLALQNRDPLRFVIDDPGDVTGFSTVDPGGVSEEVTRMNESVSAYLRVIGKQMEKMEKAYARGRVSLWAKTMASMADMLGGIEGRKHVVYFSEGFDGRLLLGRQPDPMSPDEQREFQAVTDGEYWMVDNDDRFGNTVLQMEINMSMKRFRESNAVIHAVDISGLRADLPAQDRARRVGRDALYTVANETGGALYEDANDFGRELDEVLSRSSVTYLLSFSPTEPGEPGEYREIKVKLKGDAPGRLSYRSGYEVPRPFDELHPMERGLLAADLIATATIRNDFDMNVLSASFRANETTAYVPVIVELEGTGLLAGHESDRLPVEIFTYVTDDKGQMRDFFTQIVALDLGANRDRFEKTGLKYYGHVELGSGEYLVRVLARNALTGATSVRTVPVSVPEYAEQPVDLLPPFFIEEPGKWFLVREQQDGDEYSRSRIYPFTVNGEPYVPAAMPGISEGGSAELCLVAYNLGEGEIEVESVVHDKNGSPVSGGRLALSERTVTGISGLDKLTATFEPAGLDEGEYRLEVALVDPATRVRQVSSIPFRITNGDS